MSGKSRLKGAARSLLLSNSIHNVFEMSRFCVFSRWASCHLLKDATIMRLISSAVKRLAQIQKQHQLTFFTVPVQTSDTLTFGLFVWCKQETCPVAYRRVQIIRILEKIGVCYCICNRIKSRLEKDLYHVLYIQVSQYNITKYVQLYIHECFLIGITIIWNKKIEYSLMCVCNYYRLFSFPVST